MDLERFVDAQRPVWPTVEKELISGRKTSHWMWFVFPQLAGLGRSSTAAYYGISSLEHAHRYLRHPVLGSRLVTATKYVLEHNQAVSDLFPYPDDLKFHSCMTLFSHCPDADPVFEQALEKFFDGIPDKNTVLLLSSAR